MKTFWCKLEKWKAPKWQTKWKQSCQLLINWTIKVQRIKWRPLQAHRQLFRAGLRCYFLRGISQRHFTLQHYDRYQSELCVGKITSRCWGLKTLFLRLIEKQILGICGIFHCFKCDNFCDNIEMDVISINYATFLPPSLPAHSCQMFECKSRKFQISQDKLFAHSEAPECISFA